jgi:hypothetical protein
MGGFYRISRVSRQWVKQLTEPKWYEREGEASMLFLLLSVLAPAYVYPDPAHDMPKCTDSD